MKGANQLNGFFSNLGSVVRVQRQNLGITQEELAHRVGLHRTYVTDNERGTRNLTIETVSKLSAAFDIQMAELFVRAEK